MKMEKQLVISLKTNTKKRNYLYKYNIIVSPAFMCIEGSVIE